MDSKGAVFLGRAIETPDPRNPLIRMDRGEPSAVWPWWVVHHALLVGGTGGGKSTLERVMARDLIVRVPPERRILTLVDGKGADAFLAFKGQPGVLVANGPDEFHEVVVGAHQTMTKRYAAVGKTRRQALATRGRVPFEEPPYLFLIVDEYMSGLYRMKPEKRAETVGKLADIGMLGRDAGLRILLAMQRPDAKSIEAGLPGPLKAELKLRIAVVGMLGMDSMEARMAFDSDAYATRLEKLSTKTNDPQGLGLVKAGAWSTPFRVPWFADPTDMREPDADRQASWSLIPAVAA